ncbi:hypothetical protein LY76DRAFT_27031 [Colletotrichum caudatum]|nr:hypothetical protein LY76DRAFT_27031 [Colletotrichum caudatum]
MRSTDSFLNLATAAACFFSPGNVVFNLKRLYVRVLALVSFSTELVFGAFHLACAGLPVPLSRNPPLGPDPSSGRPFFSFSAGRRTRFYFPLTGQAILAVWNPRKAGCSSTS